MNILKTTILMALLTGLMVAIGGAINGSTGATIMLVISLGMNFFSYWFSDSMVLKMYDARKLQKKDAAAPFHHCKKSCTKAELPLLIVFQN